MVLDVSPGLPNKILDDAPLGSSGILTQFGPSEVPAPHLRPPRREDEVSGFVPRVADRGVVGLLQQAEGQGAEADPGGIRSDRRQRRSARKLC